MRFIEQKIQKIVDGYKLWCDNLDKGFVNYNDIAMLKDEEAYLAEGFVVSGLGYHDAFVSPEKFDFFVNSENDEDESDADNEEDDVITSSSYDEAFKMLDSGVAAQATEVQPSIVGENGRVERGTLGYANIVRTQPAVFTQGNSLNSATLVNQDNSLEGPGPKDLGNTDAGKLAETTNQNYDTKVDQTEAKKTEASPTQHQGGTTVYASVYKIGSTGMIGLGASETGQSNPGQSRAIYAR